MQPICGDELPLVCKFQVFDMPYLRISDHDITIPQRFNRRFLSQREGINIALEVSMNSLIFAVFFRRFLDHLQAPVQLVRPF